MTWDDIKVALDDFTSSDYNEMVTDQKARVKLLTIEEGAGSDCSGSDGDTDRVYTLSNTELTSNLQVYVEGRLKAPSTLIITHAASATTVEFADKIFDTDEIVIYPYA